MWYRAGTFPSHHVMHLIVGHSVLRISQDKRQEHKSGTVRGCHQERPQCQITGTDLHTNPSRVTSAQEPVQCQILSVVQEG